jgi:hypothetical protein
VPRPTCGPRRPTRSTSNPLANSLDQWTVERACLDYSELRDTFGGQPRIAVNLYQPTIRHLMGHRGVEHHGIEVRVGQVTGGARHRPEDRQGVHRADDRGTEHGLQRLMRLRRDGASLTTIAAALNTEGYRTPGNLRWHRTSVARVISKVAYPGLWSTPKP